MIAPSDHNHLDDGMTRIEGKRRDYAANGLADYLEIEGSVARRYELHDGRLVIADTVSGDETLVADRPYHYELRLADLRL